MDNLIVEIVLTKIFEHFQHDSYYCPESETERLITEALDIFGYLKLTRFPTKSADYYTFGIKSFSQINLYELNQLLNIPNDVRSQGLKICFAISDTFTVDGYCQGRIVDEYANEIKTCYSRKELLKGNLLVQLHDVSKYDIIDLIGYGTPVCFI